MKRLVQILILLVGVVIGTREALEMRSSLKWPSTEGQIISSTISKSTRDEDGCCEYELHVRYSYQVDGMVLEGNRLRVRSDSSQFLSHVEKKQAEYPVGARVKVYYDPEQPDRSVLIRH